MPNSSKIHNMTDQVSRRSKIRILVVDDHPMLREGLAMHIAAQGDMEFGGEAEDTAGALLAFESRRPDLVIVDIALKDSDGIELIRRIRERDDSAAILVWSMYPEDVYAERALRAGARGYLNKTRATQDLMEAIRSIIAGKVYVSGGFAETMLEQFVAGAGSRKSPIHDLSDRELQAFELMGHGMNTESIATKMRVSPKTVETYRIRIKRKLRIEHATELVQRATQWVLELRSGTSAQGSSPENSA
jgi:DNA-binding NarL/FixJ family response regulator